jgi:hypothetical protein
MIYDRSEDNKIFSHNYSYNLKLLEKSQIKYSKAITIN